MAINKVQKATGETLIDLTADTLTTPTQLLKGITAHANNGEIITGTLEQGGSTTNTQVYQSYATTSSTTYTATAVSVNVRKNGNYRISWLGWRNTNGGTNGSQLYINGVAYGSPNTTFINTYGQYTNLTDVSLKEGDNVVVYARSRSSSYTMAVGHLIVREV